MTYSSGAIQDTNRLMRVRDSVCTHETLIILLFSMIKENKLDHSCIRVKPDHGWILGLLECISVFGSRAKAGLIMMIAGRSRRAVLILMMLPWMDKLFYQYYFHHHHHHHPISHHFFAFLPSCLLSRLDYPNLHFHPLY